MLRTVACLCVGFRHETRVFSHSYRDRGYSKTGIREESTTQALSIRLLSREVESFPYSLESTKTLRNTQAYATAHSASLYVTLPD